MRMMAGLLTATIVLAACGGEPTPAAPVAEVAPPAAEAPAMGTLTAEQQAQG